MKPALKAAIADTIARYDLLTHPFYTAWSRGELTREQLHFYGEQYLAHVAAFPTYLTALHARLPEGATRRAVLSNAFEEEADGRSHADLWRDFVRGMADTKQSRPETVSEVTALVDAFASVARGGAPVAAMAAFHAYESQVPRIATEKRRGLREHYGADAATCEYFRVHETADVHHARVWEGLLESELQAAATHGPEAEARCEAEILRGTELAARALWTALDGIEAGRKQLAAA